MTIARAPGAGARAGLRSSFVTPRNVVYQGEEVTVVEYFGQAAIVIDRKAHRAFRIWTSYDVRHWPLRIRI